jgi:hypothetical protein
MHMKGAVMFASLIGSLFGCSHKRTTFPLTPGHSAAGHSRNGTYVACLDCGKEFAYDWKTMSIGEQVPELSRTAPQPIVVRRTA